MTNNLTVKNSNSFLSSDNFEHALRVAEVLSKTEMVPKSYKGKPNDILVAMEMGAALGLAPLSAIQTIAVINGKPSIYGDGLLAICSGHPDFENIKEEPIYDGEGKIMGYRCCVKRKDRKTVVQEFTVEQAKQAKLWGKAGPWTEYPERMLQMRARAFALRDSFADALGGVRLAEEVQDYEMKDVTPKGDNSSSLDDLIADKDNFNEDK